MRVPITAPARMSYLRKHVSMGFGRRYEGDNLPVVEFVDGESAADEAGSEDRSVDGNELPHGGMVV
jgi:hypothetical protein